MNLLFIGDVVGQSGCDFLESRMYKLKREYDLNISFGMSKFHTVVVYAETQCSCGFRHFLFVWLSSQVRCANFQKSPNKNAKNSF